MKNALIVGGSNGLGAAIVYEVQSQDCEIIYILDLFGNFSFRTSLLDRIQSLSYGSHVTYLNIDLSKDNLHILDQFNDIDILVITAGSTGCL
ncbi:hypothetical protein Holit_03236 [Hollandina sp. SP2]